MIIIASIYPLFTVWRIPDIYRFIKFLKSPAYMVSIIVPFIGDHLSEIQPLSDF